MAFPGEEDDDVPPIPTEPDAAMLTQHVSMLGLSTRTVNNLNENDVHTVNDLLHCCPKPFTECGCLRKHLLSFTNFGEKTLGEVYQALSLKGFKKSKSRKKKEVADDPPPTHPDVH